MARGSVARQPLCDVGEDFAVGVGALGGFRVRVVAADPAAEFQEHRGAVLVGGHGRAECEEAEILQEVVEFVNAGSPESHAASRFAKRSGANVERPSR